MTITCGIQTTGFVTMGTKWYIVVVTWAFVISLICMPSDQANPSCPCYNHNISHSPKSHWAAFWWTINLVFLKICVIIFCSVVDKPAPASWKQHYYLHFSIQKNIYFFASWKCTDFFTCIWLPITIANVYNLLISNNWQLALKSYYRVIS